MVKSALRQANFGQMSPKSREAYNSAGTLRKEQTDDHSPHQLQLRVYWHPIGEGLKLEYRVDQVSIFGSIALTLDKEGSQAAKELKEILDPVLKQMEHIDFPDRIAVAPVETVDNPFV